MGKDAEFLDAARTGNIQVVEKVLNSKARRSGPLASLRRGPGANVQDSSGYTALHHAALNGHRSVVSLLLRHEASVNVQDDKGSTPLHLAAWAGHDHVIKVLLTQGPSIPHINHQNKGGDTALHFSAQYGHTETTRLLLKKGGDPTLPNLKAETPLDLAAQFGRLSIAELLLRDASDLLRPFSVDAATAAVFPHTPLHLASRNGHLNVVKLLLNHGHHVNVRTSLGSPLHEAALCGKVDVVRALMEAGADSEVKNDLGHTVLDTIASINTPVTQEISGLIKSQHARLIDIDDDPPSLIPVGETDKGRSFEGKRPPSTSPSSSVNTTSSFNFPDTPILQPKPYPLSSSPSPSVPILFPTTSSPSLGRPSSAPSNPFHLSVVGLRPGSLRSVSSTSSSPPLSLPPSLPPSECGEVYENVLVPVKLYKTDGDSLVRSSERRSLGKGGSGVRVPSSSRCDSRLSDKEMSGGLHSDREGGGGGGRYSDYDGRASITSEYSSVYDVPPPPSRIITSTSDRSSISTRSSSAHDILEDDGNYEVPPPPRVYHPSLRTPKELSDGESSKPHPPPKPPRRSICPPSPTNNAGGEDRSYEMICFATTGQPEGKGEYENSVGSKHTKTSGRCSTSAPEYHYKTLGQPGRANHKTLGQPGRANHKYGHCSSDSDSDVAHPTQYSGNFFNNKGYSTMSFKPVKSRRTTKAHNTYENTIHRYENIRQPHTHRKSHSGVVSNQNLSYVNVCNSTNGPSSERTSQKPWGEKGGGSPSRQRYPQRAKSAHGIRGSGGGSDWSSDDSECGKRPKSLDILLDDPTGVKPVKRNSKDAETETDPEDSSANVEVKSRAVGGSSPLTTEAEENRGVGKTLNGGRSIEGGLLERGESSCSLSSASVASLSDRSASTDNIEEVRGDVPFAGLYRGSRLSGEWMQQFSEPQTIGVGVERPKSLTPSSSSPSAFRAFDRGCRSSFPNMRTFSSKNNHNNNNGCSNENLKDHSEFPRAEKGSVLSPLEEDEEWARISDIMASFGGGVTRESVFMAELEQEFQQRLGLSLSPSQQKSGFLIKTSEDSGDGVNGTNTSKSSPPVAPSAGSLPTDVGTWLKGENLAQYEATFLANGYDNVNFLNGLLDYAELDEMGVSDPSHRERLMRGVSSLPSLVQHPHGLEQSFDTLEDWLSSIHLQQYIKVFRNHGFGEMERVRKIWEVELSVVLEVTQAGHRKRMLASLGDRPIEPELPALAPQELSLELSKLNTDISELKEKLFHELPSSTCRERRPPESATNTIRKGTTKRRAAPPPPPKAPRGRSGTGNKIMMESKNSSSEPGGVPKRSAEELPLRDPSQLVVGVPQTVLSEWKHHPTKLVTACVQYVAQYLGSTHIKEVKGTESTMKSIHKLRKSSQDVVKIPNIVLAVSYKGVRFIDAATQHVVCEHEIRNIHCACQDADDLCHFAYITTDAGAPGHYCHVFRVQSRDLATEIIMTLGEAFEVAYQISLRDKEDEEGHRHKFHQSSSNGHSRSKSEHLRNFGRGISSLTNGSFHSRSLSAVGTNFPQYAPSKGTAAPNTSLENLLSDSGNFSDKDVDSSSYCRRESSSPSVGSSNSGSTNNQHQKVNE
ncbi:UNVERIFIED_CONTAM: hypothetical protein RMT77_006686 [Armadillidium vulgare]